METKQEHFGENQALHYIFLFYAFLITCAYAPLCFILTIPIFKYFESGPGKVANTLAWETLFGAAYISAVGICGLLGLIGYWISVIFAKKTHTSNSIKNTVKFAAYSGFLSIILVVLYGIYFILFKEPFKPDRLMISLLMLPFVLLTLPLAYRALSLILENETRQ